MFSRLIPKRYHHLCPEYQGFTLIVLKPNEGFVEPKRAARRLRQCMAILIYAQQWIHEVVDADVVICPIDVTRSLTRVVEILSDRNATWNANGRIMRPANLLLDCFNAVYESLNSLQRTIKNLTGKPVYLAQNRATRCLIGSQLTKIRTAISELLTVMEAMPRRKAGTTFRPQSQVFLDYEEEEEDATEAVDIRFGFTLSNASLEELNQIKHRSISVQARERKRTKMASSLRSTSQTSLESAEPLNLKETRASVSLDEKEVLVEHHEDVNHSIMASTPVDIKLDESKTLPNEDSSFCNQEVQVSLTSDEEVRDFIPEDVIPAPDKDETTAMTPGDNLESPEDAEQDTRPLHEAVEATLARWSVISGASSEDSRVSAMFSIPDSDGSSDTLTLIDTVPQLSEHDAASIKNVFRAHQLNHGLERPVSMKRANRPEPILTLARSTSRQGTPQRARL